MSVSEMSSHTIPFEGRLTHEAHEDFFIILLAYLILHFDAGSEYGLQRSLDG